jgi:hypothetical protein
MLFVPRVVSLLSVSGLFCSFRRRPPELARYNLKSDGIPIGIRVRADNIGTNGFSATSQGAPTTVFVGVAGRR